MKAKHIPLLVAITAIIAAVVYFFISKAKATPQSSTNTVTAKNTATAKAPTDNSKSTTPPATTTGQIKEVWSRARSATKYAWDSYTDVAKTKLEYKEPDGILHVRGTICLKKAITYTGYGTNAGAPTFVKDASGTNHGTYTFPSTISLADTPSRKDHSLPYAKLFVSNEGEKDYWGHIVPAKQFALNFKKYDEVGGCVTFYFSKT